MKSSSSNLLYRGLQVILVACSFIVIGTASANADNPIPTVADQWRVEVSPYVWAPGIKGTMGFDNGLRDLRTLIRAMFLVISNQVA